MKAAPGDRLIVKSAVVGQPARDGEVIEVRGANDNPPYVIRWSDTGHDSLYFPGDDAELHHAGDAITDREG